jgi:uracil-DNA glycosylase family 4
MPETIFDPSCRRCDRLAAFLSDISLRYSDYHAAPVAPFGDPDARLLIVGLAPGLHGANRTGRPFTGDYAGILLYETLHRHGFASAPRSTSVDDGLMLHGCRITNAVKCVPPENKPTTDEVRNCNGYLKAELEGLPADAIVLALGRIAHNAVLRARGLRQSQWRFGHAAEHRLADGPRLVDSYHCSRYNTQTGRLTPDMFDAVLARCRALLDEDRAA